MYTNMNAVVECRSVSRIYSQGETAVHALSSVNLIIKRGEFVSISGPSGSGKSTLLNLIGGLDLPSTGEVWVAGQPMHSLSNSERAQVRLQKIGFIFQSYNLIPVLTAQENVEFVLQLRGVAAKERRTRSRELLNTVGLGTMLDRRPGELSGGQQQRVAVARAIVGEPELVLADEPTANLDTKTAANLLELMQKMNTERGVTFIFSTHHKLVMEFARRLIVLEDGCISSDEVRA